MLQNLDLKIIDEKNRKIMVSGERRTLNLQAIEIEDRDLLRELSNKDKLIWRLFPQPDLPDTPENEFTRKGETYEQAYERVHELLNDRECEDISSCTIPKFLHEVSIENQTLRKDSRLLNKIKEIITGYYHALDTRQNGDIAQNHAFSEIQSVLKMYWVQGETLKK